MKLQGKRALVTGADSGIGQAIARAFGKEGAHVAVHYHSDKAGAEQTAADVRARGREAAVMQCDLSEPEKAEGLFEEAVKALGGIDILVNCAGLMAEAEQSVDMPLEDFHRVIHVNLIAPWVLCQAAAKHMSDRDGTAAKAGLRNITRNLSRELAKQGIRVNNIAPGFIATPMTEDALSDPKEMEESRKHIPLARPGRPEEVAAVALFLASDDASYITGSSYFVDGGLLQMVGAGA